MFLVSSSSSFGNRITGYRIISLPAQAHYKFGRASGRWLRFSDYCYYPVASKAIVAKGTLTNSLIVLIFLQLGEYVMGVSVIIKITR